LVIRADDLVAKPSTRLQRLLNLLLYLLSYWSFHQATKVLVPSDELTDVARRMFRLDQSDVAVSYNGVDRERFSNTRQIGPRLVWRRSHTVVFSGALSALRGVDILLRAIPAIKKAVPDLEVVILGDGPDLPRLVEISESLQLRDCVHFLGSVPPDTVSKHLSVARVAIGPLRASSQTFGAFPIKVLEYMAAGCVVVAGVQTVSSRLVSDRVNGLLVRPGDPIDLARAILTIFSDDRLAERIGQKGRETASRYGWEIVVSQLERTLLSALDFGGIKADGST
jgi:glycosyltransferase involved in cell wall biosynthesis